MAHAAFECWWLLSGSRVRALRITFAVISTHATHIWREGRNFFRLLLVRRIDWTVDDCETEWWVFVVVWVHSLIQCRRLLEINKFETFTIFLLEKMNRTAIVALTTEGSERCICRSAGTMTNANEYLILLRLAIQFLQLHFFLKAEPVTRTINSHQSNLIWIVKKCVQFEC